MSRKKKMTIWISLAIVVIVLVGVFFLHKKVFSGANPPLPRGTLQIGNNIFSVELATTMLEQARGLSGREGLGANDGMLFIFPSSTIQNFWMKDMNFAIDIIWIGDGKVLGWAADAQPQPGVPLWALDIFTSPDGVNTVLEVPAGTVQKDGITVGEPVAISQ